MRKVTMVDNLSGRAITTEDFWDFYQEDIMSQCEWEESSCTCFIDAPCGKCTSTCECGSYFNDDGCTNEECEHCSNYYEGEQEMNPTTAILLVRDDVRGIAVDFGDGKSYTYKSFDKDIKEGDFVILPAKEYHGAEVALFSVAKVSAVDMEIPVESSTKYKWIIARFDMVNYVHTIDMENKLVSTIGEIRKQKKRRELQEDLKGMLGDDFEKLMAIAYDGEASATDTDSDTSDTSDAK